MKKIVIINNNDSFVYNIVELLRSLSADIKIITDTADVKVTPFSLSDLGETDGIILSPGAGIPEEYTVMNVVLNQCTEIPILGVCLGHQAIAKVAGADLECMQRPLHGHPSKLVITDSEEPVFQGIPQESRIGRYHSWVVSKANLPECLRITAEDEYGNIQALAHKFLPRKGVQFHPESIITEYGKEMIKNWLAEL